MQEILFISEYSQKGCQWVRNGMKMAYQGFNLIFLDIGMDKPVATIDVLVDKMVNSSETIQLIDTKDINYYEKDFADYVKSKIRKYSCKYICFITCEQLYKRLLPELHEYKVYLGSNIKAMKNKIEKEKVANVEKLNDFEKVENKIDSEQINRNNNQSMKYFGKTEVTNPINKSMPHSGSRTNISLGAAIKGFESNDMKESVNRGDAREQPKIKHLEKEAPKKNHLEELENKIFNTKAILVNEVEQPVMTKLDRSRTQYINDLYDDLSNEVKKYIKDRDLKTITEKQIMEFLKLIVKSDTLEDYLICCQCMGINAIKICADEKVFQLIKKKATYYTENCNLVFQQR